MLVAFERGVVFQQAHEHVLEHVVGVAGRAGLRQRDAIHDIAPRVHGFEQERVGSKRFRAVAGCGGLVFSLERQAHAFTSLVTIRARV